MSSTRRERPNRRLRMASFHGEEGDEVTAVDEEVQSAISVAQSGAEAAMSEQQVQSSVSHVADGNRPGIDAGGSTHHDSVVTQRLLADSSVAFPVNNSDVDKTFWMPAEFDGMASATSIGESLLRQSNVDTHRFLRLIARISIGLSNRSQLTVMKAKTRLFAVPQWMEILCAKIGLDLWVDRAYAAIIVTFHRHGLTTFAFRAYKTMCEKGYQVPVCTLGLLVDLSIRDGDRKRAEEMLMVAKEAAEKEVAQQLCIESPHAVPEDREEGKTHQKAHCDDGRADEDEGEAGAGTATWATEGIQTEGFPSWISSRQGHLLKLIVAHAASMGGLMAPQPLCWPSGAASAAAAAAAAACAPANPATSGELVTSSESRLVEDVKTDKQSGNLFLTNFLQLQNLGPPFELASAALRTVRGGFALIDAAIQEGAAGPSRDLQSRINQARTLLRRPCESICAHVSSIAGSADGDANGCDDSRGKLAGVILDLQTVLTGCAKPELSEPPTGQDLEITTTSSSAAADKNGAVAAGASPTYVAADASIVDIVAPSLAEQMQAIRAVLQLVRSIRKQRQLCRDDFEDLMHSFGRRAAKHAGVIMGLFEAMVILAIFGSAPLVDALKLHRNSGNVELCRNDQEKGSVAVQENDMDNEKEDVWQPFDADDGVCEGRSNRLASWNSDGLGGEEPQRQRSDGGEEDEDALLGGSSDKQRPAAAVDRPVDPTAAGDEASQTTVSTEPIHEPPNLHLLPDIDTYAVAIESLYAGGAVSVAERLYMQCLECLFPNPAVFSAVIFGRLSSGNGHGSAEALFEMNSRGFPPHQRFLHRFLRLMGSFHERGLEVIQRLGRGPPETLGRLYHTLMEGCMQAESSSRRAHDVYNAMRAAGIEATLDTSFSMLKAISGLPNEACAQMELARLQDASVLQQHPGFVTLVRECFVVRERKRRAWQFMESRRWWVRRCLEETEDDRVLRGLVKSTGLARGDDELSHLVAESRRQERQAEEADAKAASGTTGNGGEHFPSGHDGDESQEPRVVHGSESDEWFCRWLPAAYIDAFPEEIAALHAVQYFVWRYMLVRSAEDKAALQVEFDHLFRRGPRRMTQLAGINASEADTKVSKETLTQETSGVLQASQCDSSWDGFGFVLNITILLSRLDVAESAQVRLNRMLLLAASRAGAQSTSTHVKLVEDSASDFSPEVLSDLILGFGAIGENGNRLWAPPRVVAASVIKNEGGDVTPSGVVGVSCASNGTCESNVCTDDIDAANADTSGQTAPAERHCNISGEKLFASPEGRNRLAALVRDRYLTRSTRGEPVKFSVALRFIRTHSLVSLLDDEPLMRLTLQSFSDGFIQHALTLGLNDHLAQLRLVGFAIKSGSRRIAGRLVERFGLRSKDRMSDVPPSWESAQDFRRECEACVREAEEAEEQELRAARQRRINDEKDGCCLELPEHLARKVHLVATAEELRVAVAELAVSIDRGGEGGSSTATNEEDVAARIGCKGCVLGLDVEWRPCVEKRGGMQKHRRSSQALHFEPCATLQVASDAHAIVIDLLEMASDHSESRQALSEVLVALFDDPRLVKLGFGLRNDLQRLAASYPSLSCFRRICCVLDVQDAWAKQANGEDGTQSGLSALCERHFGKPLSKRLQTSDWGHRPLSQEQLLYAALDAHCLIGLARKLPACALSVHTLAVNETSSGQLLAQAFFADDRPLDSVEELQAVDAHIVAKGKEIRALKESGAPKASWQAEVAVLLQLKARFRDLSGIEWTPAGSSSRTRVAPAVK